MENLNVILNFVLASGLLGTLVFYRAKRRKENAAADSVEIENTEQVVKIQSEHITRLDDRVEKLEEKVDKLEIIIDKKDSEIDCQQTIIRQAYKCKHSLADCPVLIKRAELDKQARL